MSCNVSNSWLQILVLVATMTAFPGTFKQQNILALKQRRQSLWLAALGGIRQHDLEQPIEQALFGLGCFWNHQETFSKLDGVVQVTSGFAGMEENNRKASYISVCGGDGRTEALLIEFLPNVVSYQDLLQTFWQQHNASEIQRPQYQSIIFPFNKQQQEFAELGVQNAKEAYRIQAMGQVRTLVSLSLPPQFTPAESMHQNFWSKLRLKLLCLTACIVSSSSARPTAMTDGLVTDVTLKLILIWVLWEVSRMIERVPAFSCYR
jgi:peptide-methionine (S)-S-oxide reductase